MGKPIVTNECIHIISSPLVINEDFITISGEKRILDALDKTTRTERLLEYIKNSGDFPDFELVDNIVKTSKEFRRNFKLSST